MPLWPTSRWDRGSKGTGINVPAVPTRTGSQNDLGSGTGISMEVAALPSAQADQAAHCQVGAQEQGNGGHELQGVAQQPVLGALEQRLGGLRPQFQEPEGDDDQQEID